MFSPTGQDPTSQLRALGSRIRVALTLLLIVLGLGTAGFYLSWRPLGASWGDAAFMTVITITTVGYSEIHPLGTAGRIVAVAVSLSGIASLFYLLSAVMDFLVSRQFRDPLGRSRMQQRIEDMRDHVIIAGYGRMGQRAAEELALEGVPFVVIDSDPGAEVTALEAGHVVLVGDAQEDEILERAGVKRARGLIVAADDDATNAFVVMGARGLNPSLTIVARADDQGAVRKLEKAGADRAIDLYTLGGRRLALSAVRPTAASFFSETLRDSGSGLSVQEVELPPGGPLPHHSLRELALRTRTGASVLAVFRQDRSFPNPQPDLVLEPGDRLLVLGDLPQLEALRALARPPEE